MVFNKGVSFKITYPRSCYRIILGSLITFNFLEKEYLQSSFRATHHWCFGETSGFDPFKMCTNYLNHPKPYLCLACA